LDENKRTQLIREIRREGGIVMLHQKLQVHQNGAKFSVNKVYVEDELILEEKPYTMILLPEKILPSCIVLTHFNRLIGPEIYKELPKGTLNSSQLSKIQYKFDSWDEPGEFTTSSIGRLNSINYRFNVSSEWERTGIKDLMISIILDSKPLYYEEIARENINQFVEKFKNSKYIYKAFYEKEGEEKEISKAKEEVMELLSELKNQLGFS